MAVFRRPILSASLFQRFCQDPFFHNIDTLLNGVYHLHYAPFAGRRSSRLSFPHLFRLDCTPTRWLHQRTSRSYVGEHILRLVQLDLSHLRHQRFRPQNSIELRENGEIVVSFDDSFRTVQLRSAQVSSGPEKDGFTFDRVFPPGTKQHEVFDYGVKE